jgi:AcrR family transcriptional regulator
VPRSADPRLPEQWLGHVVDYVLLNGIRDLSLRPLGRAVGVSPRTLLYHFGSKDALVVAVLEEARKRQRALLDNWLARTAEYDLATLLIGAWRWLSAPRHDRLLRLYFESYGASLQERRLYAPFIAATGDDWLAFFRQVLEMGGLAGERAANLAPIMVAYVRGLLLDLLATGARTRVDRAFRSFITAVELPAVR